MLREGRAFWLKIGFLTHCKNGDLAICLDPSKQLKLPSHLWHCRSTKVQSFRCVCDNIVNIAGIVHLHQILLLESQIITVPRKGLFLILNMHTQTCDSSHNFFFQHCLRIGDHVWNRSNNHWDYFTTSVECMTRFRLTKL